MWPDTTLLLLSFGRWAPWRRYSASPNCSCRETSEIMDEFLAQKQKHHKSTNFSLVTGELTWWLCLGQTSPWRNSGTDTPTRRFRPHRTRRPWIHSARNIFKVRGRSIRQVTLIDWFEIFILLTIKLYKFSRPHITCAFIHVINVRKLFFSFVFCLWWQSM